MTTTTPTTAKQGRQSSLVAFARWIDGHSHYSKRWPSLTKEAKQIVHGAVMGLRSLTPFAWNTWWATNHMRYIGVKGLEQRLVYEMLSTWLGEVAGGRTPATASKKRDD